MMRSLGWWLQRAPDNEAFWKSLIRTVVFGVITGLTVAVASVILAVILGISMSRLCG